MEPEVSFFFYLGALICFVPDPETGAPHAALGMLMGITAA